MIQAVVALNCSIYGVEPYIGREGLVTILSSVGGGSLCRCHLDLSPRPGPSRLPSMRPSAPTWLSGESQLKLSPRRPACPGRTWGSGCGMRRRYLRMTLKHYAQRWMWIFSHSPTTLSAGCGVSANINVPHPQRRGWGLFMRLDNSRCCQWQHGSEWDCTGLVGTR